MTAREPACKDMNTLLVHIGYPKALSTWLQTCLFKPELGYQLVGGASMVIRGLRAPAPFCFDGARARAFVDKHMDKTGPGMVPVISAEHISGNPERGGFDAEMLAHRLQQACPGAKILIIVRNQSDMIRSLYSGLIRTGGMPYSIERMLTPVASTVTPQFNLDYLRYDALVSYYQQLFGPESVLVLPYEMFISQAEEFISRINAFSQNQIQRPKPLPVNLRINRRTSLLSLALIRIANRYLFRNGFDDRGWLNDEGEALWRRVRIAHQLDKLFARMTPDALDRHLENRFRLRVEKITGNTFEQSNQRLEQLTGLSLAKYGYRV